MNPFGKALPLTILVILWLSSDVVYGEGLLRQADWFRGSLIGMEVGPTGPQSHEFEPDKVYSSRFNGTEIINQSIKAGSQYMVIWGRDGEFAYYDSKIQPKAPGLGDRDVLRECVEAARPHNHPVIVYCVLQYPSLDLRNHPEWKMVQANGKPIDYLVCFNSPYRDHIKGILSEIMEYDIAGFHLDMVDQGFGPPHGCWCQHCRRKFEDRFNYPMPENEKTWDNHWDRILQMRYETSREFEEELVQFIKDRKPSLSVDFNYHGNPPFSWETGQLPVPHANTGDFVTGETGLWGFSALGVGLNAQFYRAATPGLPYQVAIQRGVRMYHDQTTRPLNDMRWETLTLLSHGAFVTMIDKTGFDGSLDPVAYHRFGRLFSEVHAKAAYFGHTPVYDVGLFFSSRTRDWYGRDTPAEYFRSFQGAHKACVYDHLTFGVLHEANLNLEAMKQFPVIAIPNAAILDSANTISILEAYVRQGGNLLITGQTGQFDRMGDRLPDSTLVRLIGANVVEAVETKDNWVSLPEMDTNSKESGLLSSIPPDWTFLNIGPATIYKPTDARALGRLYSPHRSIPHRHGRGNPDWPMSPDKPVGPAVLIHDIPDGGKVLTLAASPDYSAATDHHIPETRRHFSNAVRYLNPTPRVRIQAPTTVESVTTIDPETGDLHIHFIATASPPQTTPAKDRPYVLPGLTEDIPIFRVRIDLNDEATSAEAFGKRTQINFAPNNITAIIEDIHEIITIRF